MPTLNIDPSAVNSDSPIPVYLQVEQDLRRHIMSNGTVKNTRLPRETELAQIYGISRMTLRNALERLEEGQFIRREHGVGTIITPQRSTITCDLSLMKRLQTQIKDQGYEPGVRIVKRVTLPAPVNIALKLQVETGSSVILIERAVLVDGKPIALIRSWLPEPVFPDIIQRDLEQNSIWQTIEAVYGRKVHSTSNTIELAEVSSAEADILEMKEGQTALCLAGVAADQAGVPMEFSFALWSQNARIHFEASASH